MPKNILIITESMVPFSNYWGACQRVYFYSQALRKHGNDVSIICKNSLPNTRDGIKKVNDIDVIGIGGSEKNLQSTSTNKNNIYGKLKYIDRNFEFISKISRNLFRLLYSEPNVYHGYESIAWAKSIKGFVQKKIIEEHIDLVILSGPTFGPFYLVEDIKKLGVKVVLDYRDPWIFWYEKFSFASHVEKKAVTSSDMVVTTTDSLTSALKNKYYVKNVHTIMNGYDEEKWNGIKKRHNKSKLIISYIGNISLLEKYSYRDATTFIKAFNEFADDKNDIEGRFIGIHDDISQLSQYYKKHIKYMNAVPVEDALKYTAESDVLLMFHTSEDPSGKYIICGKAFDAIRSGNFILSIGDKAYGNKNFVNETQSGIHCNNNVMEISDALEEIYSKWKTGNLKGSNVDPSIYSRNYQNEKFVKLIDALC